MTIRDREVLELLRDEPELLAVAQAVAATQPRRQARRWRRPAALLAAAAAVAALVLVAPWDRTRGGDVVAAALAAVGDRPVTHALLRSTGRGATIVDTATGQSRPAVTEIELWYDRERSRLRTVVRRQGVVTMDVTEGGSPGALGRRAQALAPSVDAGLLGFATGYRQALADGSAEVVDRDATLNGQPVHWLRVRGALSTEDVAVSTQSYRPLVVRPSLPGGAGEPPLSYVVRFETLPRAEAAFAGRRAAGLDQVYGGESKRLRGLRASEVPSAFSPRALWPGPAPGGLTLRRIELQQLSRMPVKPGLDVGEGRGLELVYGDLTPRGTVDRDGSFLAIRQATRPEPAYGFLSGQLTIEPVPPPGSLALTFVPIAGQPGRGTWLARMRRDGLWLVMEGSTRTLVVHAAQRLRRFGAAG